jgi:translation initiation factor 2B subunit (eIF-2B alpha/beta/delta family)
MDLLKNFRETFNVTNLTNQVASVRKTAQMVEALITMLQDNKISASVREMLNGLSVLIKDQPNITAVNHFINHFLLKLNPEDQPIVLKELLEVFHERWKNVDRKTADVAFQLIDFEDKTILMYGADKIMQSLVEACLTHQKKIKVIQALSKNDTAGKEQVEAILKHNISVTVTEIHNIARLKDEIDYIFLPAEIIMTDVFVSKSGAHLLASLGQLYNIPVYVLSDTRKILNKKYFPASVLETFVGESKKNSADVWKNAPSGVQVLNNTLEQVPNELITHFIFEQKSYNPEELSQEVDKILVSKFI